MEVKKTTYVRQVNIDAAEKYVSENLKWVERHQATLDQWIKTNGATATTTVSAVLMVAVLAVQWLF